MRIRTFCSAACAVALLLVAASSTAQGRGNGVGKGRTKGGQTSAEASVAVATGGAAAPTVRQFGNWLDDGTLADPGTGWISIGFGRYSSLVGHQTDFPTLDSGFGWSPRVQLGMSVPYSRFTATDGFQASGRGDAYFSAKIALRDGSRGESPIAITPLIEVLSDPNPENGRRVFWGVPVSTELKTDTFRLYGSAGYFSRGVLFMGGAFELPVNERVVGTTALNWTRSLVHGATEAPSATGLSRVDISGGVSYLVRPTVSAYGSLGRTISRIDDNSATFMVSGGLALTFSR